MHKSVGIDRHHQRCRHGREGRIERVVLTLLRLENTSVVKPEASTRRVRERRGVVGRVVVGDDDLHPTRV